MRVLLVEDNAELRDFLCLSLNEAGIETVAASSAAATGASGVVHRVEEDSFDALIIDSVLRNGDGISLTQQIRKGEKGCAIPIVLMSSIGTGLARRMAASAGCNEFLLKPFGLARLIEVLRHLR
jgi:DNA-binding response OmpR family regulator